MTTAEFSESLRPLIQLMQGVSLDDPAAAQATLSERAPFAGPLVQGIRAAAEAGSSAGWLHPRENGGIKFGRVVKDLDGFSVDAVLMDGPGPRHKHPNGEIDLCFTTSGAARFDGQEQGWVVFSPDSVHVPTVSGGQMLILYFLPSIFEFLMVLVSIIIGLGVAEILTGLAGKIRSRESIQDYWVHSVAMAAIFFALIQQWWEIWGLRDVAEWAFHGLLMMLAGPVGLFLMANLLFPDPMQGADLRKYYYGAMRPVWWLGALTVVLATLFRPLIFDDDLLSAGNVTSFAFLFGFIALAVSRRPILHAVILPIFLLLLLIDIFQSSFVIGVG